MKEQFKPQTIYPTADFNDNSNTAVFVEKQCYKGLPYNSVVMPSAGIVAVIVGTNSKPRVIDIENQNKYINRNVNRFFGNNKYGIDDEEFSIYFINKEFNTQCGFKFSYVNSQTGAPYSNGGITCDVCVRLEVPSLVVQNYSMDSGECITSSFNDFKSRMTSKISGIISQVVGKQLDAYHSETAIRNNQQAILDQVNSECEKTLCSWGITINFTSIKVNADQIDVEISNSVNRENYIKNN